MDTTVVKASSLSISSFKLMVVNINFEKNKSSFIDKKLLMKTGRNPPRQLMLRHYHPTYHSSHEQSWVFFIAGGGGVRVAPRVGKHVFVITW